MSVLKSHAILQDLVIKGISVISLAQSATSLKTTETELPTNLAPPSRDETAQTSPQSGVPRDSARAPPPGTPTTTRPVTTAPPSRRRSSPSATPSTPTRSTRRPGPSSEDGSTFSRLTRRAWHSRLTTRQRGSPGIQTLQTPRG